MADWLPKVVQGVVPFLSAKDIDKGANWTVELARELDDADFGIVCLAPDNLVSPWLNYEAGAITKSVNSRVCPILFGVEKHEVRPPMSQLQLTTIDQEEFILLVASIVKAAGLSIDLSGVKESVEVWWPKLAAALTAIPKPSAPDADTPAPEPAQPVAQVTEMFEELLAHMRSLDARVQEMERSSRTSTGLTRKVTPPLRFAMDILTEVVNSETAGGKVFNPGPEYIVVKVNGDAPIPKPLMQAASKVSHADGITVEVRNNTDAYRWESDMKREKSVPISEPG